jgi:hypothetical protein
MEPVVGANQLAGPVYVVPLKEPFEPNVVVPELILPLTGVPRVTSSRVAPSATQDRSSTQKKASNLMSDQSRR